MPRFKSGLIFFEETELPDEIREFSKRYKSYFVVFPYVYINFLRRKIKTVGIADELKKEFFLNLPFISDSLLEHPRVQREVQLRDYQKNAVSDWISSGKGGGVIVMPTGTGKTFVGIYAVQLLLTPTLFVVPTLSLVDQWIEKLSHFFYEEDVGEWTGRKKKLLPITVSTYDSAYISAEYLGDKFGMVVFDEAHHLPSESYRKIAEMSIAPFRLGLTATPEREDGLHRLLGELVGDFSKKIKHQDIKKGRFIADWEVREIRIRMSEEKIREYRNLMDKWKNFCLKKGMNPGSKHTFFEVLSLSFRSKEAREALLSLRKAKRIAFNTDEKIEKLREILMKHRGEKIIIFTDTQEMAYRISAEFFVPAITAEISGEERRKYLDDFSEGRKKVIVSAHVLDEGVDVPDASVAVIVSGSGSSREFIQRLGRVLRPSKPRAIMYEIISAGTSEKFSSERRKRYIEG